MSRSFLLWQALAVLVLACAVDASIFKFNSILPNSYATGDPIPVMSNSLTSSSKIMKMPFYSMPWCKQPQSPVKKVKKSLNIGQILSGDRLDVSNYQINMRKPTNCTRVCAPQDLTADESKKMIQLIEDNYRGNLVLDGIPVYEQLQLAKRNVFSRSVATGFPLGMPKKLSKDGKTYVHNHLAFFISYHDQSIFGDGDDDPTNDKEQFRVVGFRVVAYSVDHDVHKCDESFDIAAAHTTQLAATTATDRVEWSYSVEFEETDVDWSTRWDVYLKASPMESRVHWMSIINSVCVVLLLSVVIAVVLIRVLRRDFQRYNADPESLEEDREETGWKLVHGDVFRKPEYAELLAVYVGSGMQLVCMCSVTLVAACLGFLAPSNRGALFTALIFMFVLLGSYAGFTTARLAKFFKVKSWKIIFMTALYFPGQLFLGYIMLNFVHWGYNATTATPFTTMLTMFVLWFCVSLPLVLIGGAVGYRMDTMEVPCKVKMIARAVPPQPWYLRNPTAILLPGILPFCAAFVESLFILTSMWQGRIYYMFGFLGLVFVILIVTCAEATILLVYFQLVNHDHQWWWRSFLASGSYGVLLFAYSVVYYVTNLQIRGWWSSVLYFGYMFMISYFFFVMTGSIGFTAAFAFVKKIFGSIKVE